MRKILLFKIYSCATIEEWEGSGNAQGQCKSAKLRPKKSKGQHSRPPARNTRSNYREADLPVAVAAKAPEG